MEHYDPFDSDLKHSPAVLNWPEPGSEWRYHNGGLFQIVCCAVNTKTGDIDVVYHMYSSNDTLKFYKPTVFVRPLSEFLGYTETLKRRFTYERAAEPTAG